MKVKIFNFEVPQEWERDLRDQAATNFRAEIFRLIAKADPENLSRLRQGFPLEVVTWEAWQANPEDKFPTVIECQVLEVCRDCLFIFTPTILDEEWKPTKAGL